MSKLVDPSELIETSDDSKDDKIRILICKTCEVIHELPWYQGDPEYDEALHARVSQHQYPGVHRGNEIVSKGHALELGSVSGKSWADPQKRAQMLAEIGKQLGIGQGEGLGLELYDLKGNFMDDAMKCWRFKHGRTSNCEDYRADKMKLLPDSIGERKDLGLDPRRRPVQYLCQYCPMESIVQQKKNEKGGLYQ